MQRSGPGHGGLESPVSTMSGHLHGLGEMREEGSPSWLSQSSQGGWLLHVAGKPAGALPRLTCGPGSSASHSHGLWTLLYSGRPSSSAAWVQACSNFLVSRRAVLLGTLSLGLHLLGAPFEELSGKPAACVHWSPSPSGTRGLA